MTVDEMLGLWEKHHDQYLEDEKIENPETNKRELNALILLNKLAEDRCSYIIYGVGDEEIYLSTNLRKLAENINEDQIIELLRYGVLYEPDRDCLKMLV